MTRPYKETRWTKDSNQAYLSRLGLTQTYRQASIYTIFLLSILTPRSFHTQPKHGAADKRTILITQLTKSLQNELSYQHLTS